MSIAVSVAVLSLVYLVVGRLERAPALRFRDLSTPRPHLATDMAWYSVAVAARGIGLRVPARARFVALRNHLPVPRRWL